jgi:hypothetical protein
VLLPWNKRLSNALLFAHHQQQFFADSPAMYSQNEKKKNMAGNSLPQQSSSQLNKLCVLYITHTSLLAVALLLPLLYSPPLLSPRKQLIKLPQLACHPPHILIVIRCFLAALVLILFPAAAAAAAAAAAVLNVDDGVGGVAAAAGLLREHPIDTTPAQQQTTTNNSLHENTRRQHDSPNQFNNYCTMHAKRGQTAAAATYKSPTLTKDSADKSC